MPPTNVSVSYEDVSPPTSSLPTARVHPTSPTPSPDTG